MEPACTLVAAFRPEISPKTRAKKQPNLAGFYVVISTGSNECFLNPACALLAGAGQLSIPKARAKNQLDSVDFPANLGGSGSVFWIGLVHLFLTFASPEATDQFPKLAGHGTPVAGDGHGADCLWRCGGGHGAPRFHPAAPPSPAADAPPGHSTPHLRCTPVAGSGHGAPPPACRCPLRRWWTQRGPLFS